MDILSILMMVGKNMLFVTDDEKVYEKYDKIWNVVKGLLKVKICCKSY